MLREIKVRGLAEIERKLGYSVLMAEPMQEAVVTFTDRFQRGGKGAGARNNTIEAEIHETGARVTSTLNAPRQTGVSWERKNEAIFKGMAARVTRKAIERIEAQWAE